MKLLRFGPKGQEKPGVLDADGNVRDVSAHVTDFAGASVSLEALEALRAVDLSSLPVVSEPGRIGACLASVPNFFCVGLNYAKHAEETGAEPPKEPILFSKASSALSGPFDPVIIPRGSVKGDWEVELGVVIGRTALYVSEDDALDYVAGYCTINDVSEREFQIEKGGQWIKGKSAPTFGPTGPYLAFLAGFCGAFCRLQYWKRKANSVDFGPEFTRHQPGIVAGIIGDTVEHRFLMEALWNECTQV